MVFGSLYIKLVYIFIMPLGIDNFYLAACCSIKLISSQSSITVSFLFTCILLKEICVCRACDFSKSGFGPRTIIICDQVCMPVHCHEGSQYQH